MSGRRAPANLPLSLAEATAVVVPGLAGWSAAAMSSLIIARSASALRSSRGGSGLTIRSLSPPLAIKKNN